MRLVIWNCNMAFHRKYDALMALAPDIAVISECASPDTLAAKAEQFKPASQLWLGENPNKGLAVFSFGAYRLHSMPGEDQTLKFILPVSVSGPVSFSLLATWAFMGRADMADKNDPGPLMRSIEIYSALFAAGDTVMAGDFNNHVKWDRPRNPRNFIDYFSAMTRLGLISTYHECHRLSLGKEAHHTHYWQDRKEHSLHNCHIDYIFAPAKWMSRTPTVEVGSFAEWCGSGLSDHVPLVLTMD